MMLAEPTNYVFAEVSSDGVYLRGFSCRSCAGTLIVADVPLATNRIESVNKLRVKLDREAKRKDSSFVRSLARWAVSFRCEGECRELEGGVVSDPELPIWTQTIDRGVCQVPVDDCQKVFNLVSARIVLN
jgi:hypothetical protein